VSCEQLHAGREPMNAKEEAALAAIREQIAMGVSAEKCHRCGCLQQTVEALAGTEAGKTTLKERLAEARKVFVEKEYDCLGCRVCFPAIAANAFAEAFPDESDRLDLCPTEEPEARRGWPPLPGDYHVVRFRAPVAVCTLNSAELAARIAREAWEGVVIAGTMHTENLGIERVIRNVLANPHLRFLVLCGEDTQQAIGHLPGQSLGSLFEGGIDGRGRIRGAHGKRPIIKNVTGEQVDAFLRQVTLVPLIGEEKPEPIRNAIAECVAQDPGPIENAPGERPVETVQSKEPTRLVPDPAGFFVVYPETRLQRLVVEHYTKDGLLDCVIEGRTPAAVANEAIARGLLTRLDHAAYLGRELARAERTIDTGEDYVQDRAPGNPGSEETNPSCACSGSCD
jgi:tetrahydromethanopterin S-methyltransferase subunit A